LGYTQDRPENNENIEMRYRDYTQDSNIIRTLNLNLTTYNPNCKSRT